MSRPGKGNNEHRLDRELFHAWLWKTRGRRDQVSMSQSKMADYFRTSAQTPNRIIAELIAAGKVIKIRNGKYQVIDPDKTEILK